MLKVYLHICWKYVCICSKYICIYIWNIFACLKYICKKCWKYICIYVESIFAYMLKICLSALLVYTSGSRQYCAERSEIKMLQFPFWIFSKILARIIHTYFYFANLEQTQLCILSKIPAHHLNILHISDNPCLSFPCNF